MDRRQFLKTSILAAYVNPLKTVTKELSNQKTKSRKSEFSLFFLDNFSIHDPKIFDQFSLFHFFTFFTFFNSPKMDIS